MSFISEFKTFAMRGNVVDLAVGVVIGAAFGKIVSSLVSGIVMPVVGLLVGGVNFSHLKITMKEAEMAADGSISTPAVTLDYGAFIQTIVDFGLIALAIFIVIKMMNSMQKKQEEAPKAPPEPSAEEKLLSEIRDLLKAQRT